MFGAAASRPIPHRSLRGAFFSFVICTALLLVSCRSAPDNGQPQAPPITVIAHLDQALAVAFEAAEPVRTEIYVNVALRLSESGDTGAAAQILDRLGNGSADTALLVSRGWNGLASVDEGSIERARESDSRALAAITALDDDDVRRERLLSLLEIQLANENRAPDSVRASIDELYLIPDNEARIIGLIQGAVLMQAADERGILTAIVQQAIATLPVVEDPFVGGVAAADLAELSNFIERRRDVEALLATALDRIEAGLLIDDQRLDDLSRLITITSRLSSPDVAEAVAENVTPRAYRAIAYAWIGASLEGTASARYFEEALSRAAAITDLDRRGRTSSQVILERVLSDPSWNPSSAAASMIQTTNLARRSPELRLEVLTAIGVAYYLADQPEEFQRLRGLIGSSGELSALTVAVAEELYDRGDVDTARELVSLIRPTPETLLGFSTRPAIVAADLYRRLGSYDRAVQLLASSTDAQVITAEQAALVLARIPADYRPDPAVVSQLDRIE